MIIAILIFICVISCFYAYYQYTLREKINEDVKQQNSEIKQENNDLQLKNEKIKHQLHCIQLELQNSEKQLAILNNGIDQHNNAIYNLKNIEKEMRDSADQRAEGYYRDKLQKADLKYQESLKSYEKILEFKKSEIEIEKQKLQDLKDKQQAYIAARKRKEEIAANKDYYRLAIDNMACEDIKELREVQRHLTRKDVIDKVIYEGYIKPAYDILMSHLFKDNSKVGGIYMITDQLDGRVYIGQSVDIRERMRQHIKAAISCNAATNKLYKAMQTDGVHNFTFEILEEVPRDKLNEREVYWIEFYKAKEQLNSTKGGS